MEGQLAGGYQLKVIAVLAGHTTSQHWSIPMTETSRVQALLSRQNNEIDVLKARIEALEKALRPFANDCKLHCEDACDAEWEKMENCPSYIARAALGEKKNG